MELSFSHKITNQCKIYIGVTNYKETSHNFTYDPTNGNIFILAKHMFFLTATSNLPIFDRILKSYEVCTELFICPKISECAYVSALTLTNYFLRHFTGKNIAVIEQKKTF